MDSISVFRANWRVRFVAFGIGTSVAAAVFGIALGISDDLRLLYVSGALLLAVAAYFLSTKAREDLIAAVLLLFASTFLFAFFVLSQTPVLWPTVLLWAAIVVWLLFQKRFTRIITIVGAMILIAVSAWYCAFYIPVQMQRTLTHAGNGAAPPFTLEPISQTTVPVRSTRGKVLVLDFFATWCSPCIAELPELEDVSLNRWLPLQRFGAEIDLVLRIQAQRGNQMPPVARIVGTRSMPRKGVCLRQLGGIPESA